MNYIPQVNSMQSVDIDVDQIPDHVADLLVATMVQNVENYFRQPGVQEKYEEWLAARKKRLAVAKR